MMTKKLQLIVNIALMFALGGCASLSNRDAVHVFDTDGGTVALYEQAEGGEPVAYAPTLYKPERRPTAPYYLPKKDGSRERYEPECNIRWVSGVGGNVAAAAATGLMATATWATAGAALVAFAGVDYVITANGWNCSERQVLATKELATEEQDQACSQAVLAPPPHFDEMTSDRLGIAYALDRQKRTRGCERYVKYQKGKERLQFLNVSHLERPDMEGLSLHQLRLAASELGATKLVLLDLDERQTNEFAVRPMVVNLLTGEKEAVPQDRIRLVHVGNFQQRSVLAETIVRGVNLIPNSVYWGPTRVYLAGVKNHHGDLQEGESSVPSWASYGLTHVSHPRAYDMWDWDWSVSPGLSAGFASFVSPEESLVSPQARQSAQAEEAEPDGRKYDAMFGYVAATIDAGLTFHTPVGAIAGDLGVGGGPLRYIDNSMADTRFLPVTFAQASYTVFVTDHFFLRFSNTSWTLPMAVWGGTYRDATFHNENLRLRGWQTNQVVLGYFFPSLKTDAVRMLSDRM